ncbi:MAG: peptidoglycan editing factor PgeF [Acidobacteria bacterium]|nr:peptidoglycan editing factor PgeF [Acidobacteriota bacterium]
MNLPPGWVVPNWPAPRNVGAFITGRAGGVSAPPFASFNVGDTTGDDPAAAAENRRRLEALLPAGPRWLRQVHGARVLRADEVRGLPEADATVTRTAGVVCAVRIADCMPVLLCDRAGTAVGAAHAGWRGLSQGVVENTVAAMGCDPGELLAYLGPAIGPSAFEVGDDVLCAFVAVDPAARGAFAPLRPGKWLADLYALGRQRLVRAGVRAVYGGGLCTVTDAQRFFSYRRDGVTGRMAALVWLHPGPAPGAAASAGTTARRGPEGSTPPV